MFPSMFILNIANAFVHSNRKGNAYLLFPVGPSHASWQRIELCSFPVDASSCCHSGASSGALVADSLADESTEVSRESLLTDSCWSIPEPMVYK